MTAPGSVIPLTVNADVALDLPDGATASDCPVSGDGSLTLIRGQTVVVT